MSNFSFSRQFNAISITNKTFWAENQKFLEFYVGRIKPSLDYLLTIKGYENMYKLLWKCFSRQGMESLKIPIQNIVDRLHFMNFCG